MLVKLEPKDIQACWPLIMKTAHEALPDHLFLTAKREDLISDALLKGRMVAWIAQDPENEMRPVACILTTIIEDDLLKISNLEITALARLTRRPIDDKIWESGIRTLLEYKRAERCHKIIAITRDERIVEICAAMGFRTDYSFLTLDSADLPERVAVNGRG